MVSVHVAIIYAHVAIIHAHVAIGVHVAWVPEPAAIDFQARICDGHNLP